MVSSIRGCGSKHDRDLVRHAGYVLGENPVTAFAFALFLVLVVCAALGPALVPYDPLASDTARCIERPLGRTLVWHRSAWPRHFLSRRRRDPARSRYRDLASVALAFGIGTLAGLVAGYCGGWIDRIVGRAVDTIMAFPLFVLAMGIVAALGNSVANIVYATAIINLPIYARLARAEANIRRNAGFIEAARLVRQQRGADRARRNCCRTSCR